MQERMFPSNHDNGPLHTHVNINETSDPYKDIPEELLERIQKIYSLDFQMFGYDPYRIKGKS